MQQDKLTNIELKLDSILKLMAATIIENKSFKEKVVFLLNLGFSDNTIAEIIQVKSVTVRAMKSKLKKQKK